MTGIADGRIQSMGSFVLISVDSRSFGLFVRRGFVGVEGLKFDLGDYNERSIFCSLLKQLRCKIILDSLITPLKPPLHSIYQTFYFVNTTFNSFTKINKTFKCTFRKVFASAVVIIFSQTNLFTEVINFFLCKFPLLLRQHAAAMKCKISYKISLEIVGALDAFKVCIMIICECCDVYLSCTYEHVGWNLNWQGWLIEAVSCMKINLRNFNQVNVRTR